MNLQSYLRESPLSWPGVSCWELGPVRQCYGTCGGRSAVVVGCVAPTCAQMGAHFRLIPKGCVWSWLRHPGLCGNMCSSNMRCLWPRLELLSRWVCVCALLCSFRGICRGLSSFLRPSILGPLAQCSASQACLAHRPPPPPSPPLTTSDKKSPG